MTEIVPARGRGVVPHPRRRHRRHGGLHPPDPPCRRPCGDPRRPQGSHRGADDAGPDLRPAHRHGLRQEAGVLMGAAIRGWARCTASATRWRRAGLSRWRSRSAATPTLPMPTSRGASGLPFSVIRGYVGSDLPAHNPIIKFITCPFTGERLAASPAICPDIAVIHAQQADRKGNVHALGYLRRAEGGGAREPGRCSSRWRRSWTSWSRGRARCTCRTGW